MEKREAVVVVADREGFTALLGQHGHEAEDAGVHAGAHAVEHGVPEGEAPVLARIALEHGGGERLVARVEDLEFHLVFVGLPEPDDHVGERLAVHAGDEHAGFDTGVVSGGFGPHGGHGPAVEGDRSPGGAIGRPVVGEGSKLGHDAISVRCDR